jgi:hypothetical protein
MDYLNKIESQNKINKKIFENQAQKDEKKKKNINLDIHNKQRAQATLEMNIKKRPNITEEQFANIFNLISIKQQLKIRNIPKFGKTKVQDLKEILVQHMINYEEIKLKSVKIFSKEEKKKIKGIK